MCIRDRTNTVAPSLRNDSAIDFPIPLEPPVTTTTLSLKSMEIHYFVSGNFIVNLAE